MPKSNAAIIRTFCIRLAADSAGTVTRLRICQVATALALAMLSIVATKNGAVGEPATDRQCRDEGAACSNACSRFVEPGSVLICQQDCDNKKDGCIMGVNNPYRAAKPVGPKRETVDRKKANGPVVGPIKSGSGNTINPNPGLHKDTPEGTKKN